MENQRVINEYFQYQDNRNNGNFKINKIKGNERSFSSNHQKNFNVLNQIDNLD